MKEFCIVRSYSKKGKKEVVDHKVTIRLFSNRKECFIFIMDKANGKTKTPGAESIFFCERIKACKRLFVTVWVAGQALFSCLPIKLERRRKEWKGAMRF